MAVCTAHNTQPKNLASSTASGQATRHEELSIVNAPQLVEQDFGFYEGKPFYARPRGSSKTGREAHYDTHKEEPGFVDVESKASLADRCDAFLDDHLLPLFGNEESTKTELVVVVVSHGILLPNLWRRLLLRLPRKSVTIVPEILASKGQVILEHLGGWSNTGFLELTIRLAEPTNVRSASSKDDIVGVKTLSTDVGSDEVEGGLLLNCNAKVDNDPPCPMPSSQSGEVGDVDATEKRPELLDQPDLLPVQKHLQGYLTTILTIDGKDHLKGFKRTRGGIGRAEHDEKQKTMDSFFKRAKKD